MTKKHFIALAKALHSVKPSAEDSYKSEQWTACLYAIADICGAENPQFDADRFIKVAADGK